MRLIRDSISEDTALDTAVSRALMERVGAGEQPETLRLARPGAIVAFAKQDAVAPGYDAAVRAARAHGFDAILRLAGGRAAVFHEGTLSLAHAVPDDDPRAGIHRRFEATADLLVRALRRLGVDARVGEVPGEYCPGGYSVNARGEVKLAGIGQRLIAGASHMGGVIVVDGAERVRDVLIDVYDALGLDWDPSTAGSVAAEAPGVVLDDVERAILAEYAELYALDEGELDRPTLDLARRLRGEHVSAGASGASAATPTAS
jgi:octanoyl-[GcvH]:protein N-octanoyltransferase